MSRVREKPAVGLWIRLAKVYGLMLREVRREQSDSAVTLAQLDVMAQLLRHPEGMTSGQLSEALLVTAGNITGLVDRMSAQGWVRRTPSTKDQRVHIVTLTPQGKRLAAREVERHEVLLSKVLAGLGATAQRDLSEQLDHMRLLLEQKSEERAS